MQMHHYFILYKLNQKEHSKNAREEKIRGEEREKKRRYRARLAQRKLSGRATRPTLAYKAPRKNYAALAEAELGIQTDDFKRLGKTFRDVVNERLRTHTLAGTERKGPIRKKSDRPPKSRSNGVFKETNKLLLFCLRHWGLKWSETKLALSPDYKLTQPQAHSWLKFALPRLGQALYELLNSTDLIDEKISNPLRDTGTTAHFRKVITVKKPVDNGPLVTKIMAYDPRISSVVAGLSGQNAVS
jgi:hypothetical protein